MPHESIPVTNITPHLWTAEWRTETLDLTPAKVSIFKTPQLPGYYLNVFFYFEKSHRKSITFRLAWHTDPCALTPSSCCRLGGARTSEWVDVPTPADSFSAARFRLEDVTWVGFAQESWIHVVFLLIGATEWCRVERIELGIKLGSRAGMARQVFQRSGRGSLSLSWCQYPRWVRLEHYGGKTETFLLSSLRGAAPSELDTSPPDR